jgi:hypothetical protein
LQHPLIILILRALAGHESSLLLPSINAEILRPVDALLSHLEEFRFGRLGVVLLPILRRRRYLQRCFRRVLMAMTVIVIMIVIVIVIVIVVMIVFMTVFVLVLVLAIGFMSVIMRVRRLRAE